MTSKQVREGRKIIGMTAICPEEEEARESKNRKMVSRHCSFYVEMHRLRSQTFLGAHSVLLLLQLLSSSPKLCKFGRHAGFSNPRDLRVQDALAGKPTFLHGKCSYIKPTYDEVGSKKKSKSTPL